MLPGIIKFSYQIFKTFKKNGFYSIGYELLRLFGNVSTLRAPLESLFHRYLKINKSATRLELFRVTKEVSSIASFLTGTDYSNWLYYFAAVFQLSTLAIDERSIPCGK